MPDSTLTPISNTYYFPVQYGGFSFGGSLAGTPAYDSKLQGNTVTAISADGVTFTPVPTDGSRVSVTGQYSTLSVDYLGNSGEAPVDLGDNNQGLIDAIQANEGNTTPLMGTFYYQVTDSTGTTVTDQFTYQYGDVNFATNGDPATGGSEVFGGSAETVAPGSTTAIPGLSITKALATGQTQQDIDNTPLTVTISAFDFATQQADGSISFDPTKEGAGAGGTFTATDSGYVIQGTLAQINADLQGLTYTAPTSGPADDFILIQATDGPTPTAGYVEGEIKAIGTTPPPPQDTEIQPFQIGSNGGAQGGTLPNASGYTVTGISLDGQTFTPVDTTDPTYNTSTMLTGTYLNFSVNADGTALEYTPNGSVQNTIDAIHANDGNATPLSDTLYYQLTDGTTTFVDAVEYDLNDVQFNQQGTPYSLPETVQQGTATLIPGMTVHTLVPSGKTSDADEHLLVKLGVFDFARQLNDGTLSIDPTHVGAGGNTGETITYDLTSPFAQITIDGTVAQINADLQGLTYNSPSGTGDDLIAVQAVESGTTTPDFLVGEIKTTCYVQGTLIRTPRGDVAVEDLAVGDVVVTASGEERPIRWLGHQTIECGAHPKPKAVWPVRLQAGALGRSRPDRDLWVSPGHSICLDMLGEVLIRARELINGATVAQVPVDAVTYWHVELDSHDILLANNLPAESYLDMGNRAFFAGAEGMDPDPSAEALTTADFCRPLVSERLVIDALRFRLRTQALALGWTLDSAPDDDLHLLVDGAVIRPQRQGETVRFVVPAAASDVWLVSRTFVPRHIGESNDTRTLGVKLRGLSVDDGSGGAQQIGIDDPRLGEGFSVVENRAKYLQRWTTGRAHLPADLWAKCSGPFVLTLTVTSGGMKTWVAPAEAEAASVPAVDQRPAHLRLVHNAA